MMNLQLTFEGNEVVGEAVVFRFKVRNEPDAHARILGLQCELWQASDMSGSGERYIGELRLDAQATITESHWKLKTTLKPGEETPLRLIWRTTSTELQMVEDHRVGMSPVFRIKLLLLVDAIWPTQAPREKWRTSIDWEGPYCGNGWPLWLTIPDKDWIKILEKLKFKHNTLDRLKWPSLPPAFARSEEHLAAAWQNHRTGNFDAALNSCYKAFDCLGFNLTGEKIERRDVLELLMGGAELEKRHVVQQIMKDLQTFFHFGRHESGAPVSVNYLDSQLAIGCLTVVLSYLGPQSAHESSPKVGVSTR